MTTPDNQAPHIVLEKTLSHAQYALTIEEQQPEQGGAPVYVSRVTRDGVLIYASYPWKEQQKAEQEALEYYAHLRKN
ncbi:hypothetical protein [Paenibacillus sp. y28]|uniref:hypothetical protein n=1 Tax=Paenibacillus sp. y28 TaxID=3129110 RepID=UPI0030182FBA